MIREVSQSDLPFSEIQLALAETILCLDTKYAYS